MEKITIVINGVGGCGKDTLISLLSKHYKILNRTSIAPIVDIAKSCGWDGVKTDKSRKFLSDLKKLLTDFNDTPLNYLLLEQEKFLNSENELMFVHIREPEEIKKFITVSRSKTITLLITPREELQNKVYGNSSDDEVANYNYDLVFNNNKPLEITEQEFLNFINKFVFNINH